MMLKLSQVADVFTPDKRSEVMSAIKSRGNISTELRLLMLMRTAGISGWRRGSKLPGKPDFVFSKDRLAVFVKAIFGTAIRPALECPRRTGAFGLPK
jgi:DNA mismatch endonuclease (patch repair protein)